MHGAECVLHEEIVAIGELLRKSRIILCLSRIEARVLEYAHPIVWQELPKPLLDRAHRKRRIRALRASKVRADGHLTCAAFENESQGRQRSLNARLVGDAPLLERDVEV